MWYFLEEAYYNFMTYMEPDGTQEIKFSINLLLLGSNTFSQVTKNHSLLAPRRLVSSTVHVPYPTMAFDNKDMRVSLEQESELPPTY
jgi:hypothetical protein